MEYSSLRRQKGSSRAQIIPKDNLPSIFTSMTNDKSPKIFKKYSKKQKILQTLGKAGDHLIKSHYKSGVSNAPPDSSVVGFIPSDDETDKIRDNEDEELVDIDFETEAPKEIRNFKPLNQLISSSRGPITLSKVESIYTKIPQTCKPQNEVIPTIPSKRSEIMHRVKPYLHMIPDFLSKKITMSYFYQLAKDIKLKSGSDSLTSRAKERINWTQFVGGYYGINRQMFIGSIIVSNFKRDLVKTANKNRIVAFWGVEDFANYVLANEMILRLIMEDYQCDLKKAETIIKTTIDEGALADTKEVIADLSLSSLKVELMP